MAMAFLTGIFDAGTSGEVEESVAQTIFKDVISDMVDNFSLRSLGTAATTKKRVTGYGSFAATRAPEAPVPDDENSRNIVSLISHCLALKLTTELKGILNRLIEEATTLPVELFETIYIPFLKGLTTMLLEKKLPLQDLLFQMFFQSMISIYIIRYVQSKPTPPKDWVRTKLTCSCVDCRSVNTFLIDPQQRVGRFAVNKQRRQHLHSQFNGKIGFTHETERRGSPQTLVITKTQAAHQAATKAWSERSNIARNHLKSFPQDALKQLLGDKFKPNMALSASSALLGPAKSRQQEPLSSIANPSAGPADREPPPIKKRKVPSPAPVIVIDESD